MKIEESLCKKCLKQLTIFPLHKKNLGLQQKRKNIYVYYVLVFCPLCLCVRACVRVWVCARVRARACLMLLVSCKACSVGIPSHTLNQ
jgi:hypothetical protein